MKFITKAYEKTKTFLKENYKSLLVLLGIYLLFTIELPYVIYTPGGAIDLSKRIEVSDGYDSSGEFAMAYVSMVRGSLPFLGLSYIIPNWDIEAKENITYEDETMEEMMKRDRLYLEEANNNATIVAYRAAKKDITMKKSIHHIILIDPNADTSLKLYDELISVDGNTFQDLEEYRKYIQTKKEGDIVTFLVNRDGKEVSATSKIYMTDDGLKSGISIITTHELEESPELKIKTKQSESGPSGGLMTTLAIYNALVEEDITKGRFIIGTGTISLDGTVGEIGGVKYKLLGAEKKHADLFLCPMENLEEAMKVKEEEKLNILVVGVSTFEDALAYLQK